MVLELMASFIRIVAVEANSCMPRTSGDAALQESRPLVGRLLLARNVLLDNIVAFILYFYMAWAS